MARDFQTIGGLQATVNCIGDSAVSPAVWGIASEIVGMVVQNNPVTQEGAFSMDALSKLAAVAQNRVLSPSVRSKALMGISCLVRGHDGAAGAFMDAHAGINFLVSAALSEDENARVRRKCMFLLRYFAEEIATRRAPFESARTAMLERTVVTLAGVLKTSEDAALREHGLHLAMLLQRKSIPRDLMPTGRTCESWRAATARLTALLPMILKESSHRVSSAPSTQAPLPPRSPLSRRTITRRCSTTTCCQVDWKFGST